MNVHKTEINIEIVPNCFKLHPSFQNPIFKHRRRRYRERIKLICWNSFEHHIVRQRGPHELQTNINKKKLEFNFTLNFKRFEVKYSHCKKSPSLKWLFGIHGSKVVVEHSLKSNRNIFASDSEVHANSICKWIRPFSQNFR